MKPLPTEFKSKGFQFRQLKRVGDVALFERKRPTWKNPGYEVVRVRKYPTYEISGATIEAHEALPPDEAFGQEGWALASIERAEEVFAEQSKNPYTTIMGQPTGGTRGRKRNAFEVEIPASGTFTVRDLKEKYPDKSVPFIHLRLNELRAAGKVRVAGTKPSPRGKATNIYEAVPVDMVPAELQ